MIDQTDHCCLAPQDVNDNAPQFELNTVHLPSVSENIPIGTTVAKTNVSDPDQGTNGTLTFRLSGGNNDSLFNIDEHGEVRVVAALNFEENDKFLLEVTATDGGNRSAKELIFFAVINENDEAPALAHGSSIIVVVDEFTAPGKIASVNATDADGHNLVYNITAGNADSAFVINNTNGDIFLNYVNLSLSLYELEVTVQEPMHPYRAVVCYVTVRISDANDHQPVFAFATPDTWVPADSHPGSIVAWVRVFDGDRGRNSNLTYFITDVDDDNTFSVSEDGAVVLLRRLRAGFDGNLSVMVSDQGFPAPRIETVVLRLRVSEPRFSAVFSGHGALVGADDFVTDTGVILNRIVSVHSVDPSLTVDHWSLQSTASLPTPEREISHTLKGSAVDSVVWDRDPVARITISQYGNYFNTNVATQETVIHLTIRNGSSGCRNQTISCSPRAGMIMCMVQATFEPECFVGSNTTVGITAQFLNGPSNSQPTGLGQIALAEAEGDRDAHTIVSTIAAFLPVHHVVPHVAFNVPILGQHDEGISSAQVRFSWPVSANLSATGVSYNRSLYAVDMYSTTNSAVLSISLLAAVNSTQLSELASVEMVLSAVALDIPGIEINVQVEFFATLDNERFDSHAALVFDRQGEPGNGTGTVYTRDNSIMAISAQTSSSTIINTAILTRDSIHVPLVLYYVRMDGTSGVLVNATCTSANPNVVKVRSNCSHVFVDGSEVSGSSSIHVDVNFEDELVSSRLVLRVIAPVVPIELQAPSQLVPVVGTFQANCNRGFQRAPIRVVALFAGDDDDNFTADITSLAAPSLTSSNPSVAIIANGTTVSGVSTGVSLLTVSVPGIGVVSNTHRVLVDDSAQALTIAAINVETYSNLSLGVVEPETGPLLVAMNFNRNLLEHFPNSTGQIVVSTTLSDGSLMPLDAGDPAIQFSVRSEESIRVNQTRVIAEEYGTTELTARWVPGISCNSQDAYVGVGRVVVTLPVATTLDISGVVSELAFEGSLPNQAGKPSAMYLRAVVTFADGRVQDMSADPLTLWQETASSSLRISNSSRGTLLTPRTVGANGVVNISVEIPELGLQEIVTVTIVNVRRVATLMTPYPHYPGSANVSITELHLIGGTQHHQQGSLDVNVSLSTGEHFSASEAGMLVQYEITDVANTGATQASIVRDLDLNRSTVNVTGRSSHASPFSVRATLGEVDVFSASLQLTSTLTPVQLVSLEQPRIDSNDSTLSGVSGIGQVRSKQHKHLKCSIIRWCLYLLCNPFFPVFRSGRWHF